MVDADVNFIARQIDRVTTEFATLRDNIAVVTAIMLRLDGTMTELVQDTRATHNQVARMNLADAR